ncbi:MAG TPA: family 16 glycoside hydrolase, partial [Gemmataceae bacterium]|nr:family 16 glycoside hydrolase [Gemmataceae bacterium]
MWFRRTHCLGLGVLALFVAIALAPAVDAQRRTRTQDQAIIGRWDMTLESGTEKYPSWLEVRLSGRRTLVGSFVGRFGSARPISRVEFAYGQVRFSVPPQWEEREDDQRFEGRLQDGLLKGETTDERGHKVTWTAARAPALTPAETPAWKEPVELFNGKDLIGWKPRSAAVKNGWIVRDGLLVNAAPGNDLISAQQFTDFKLHAEFRYPRRSNSGIYLRGRYEMQIEDDYGDEPDSHKIGGIYGFLTPSVNAARKPGEWQSADVTLLGRVVTIVLNGERIIDRQAIPGITGGALDSDEAAPGPIMLQGDHGAIEFRRVSVSPASVAGKEPLHLHLRSRLRDKGEGAVEKKADWDPHKTALIICDMWDDHWCKSAARRVAEMAGPLNDTVKAARARGVFIIHAPSSVTSFYKDTPQRKRAQQAPFARTPVPLSTSERWGTAWCWPDPGREAALPID